MLQIFKLILTSFLSAVAGLGAGLVTASIYDWRYPLIDPDPVQFPIGAIILWVSIGVWITGAAAASLMLRRRAGDADIAI